jgi:hypothetical protein
MERNQMQAQTKRTRGPSAASVDAQKYLKRHPKTSAGELSRRFKIAVSTVRRSEWWKGRANKVTA